jgi:hypothetical protein
MNINNNSNNEDENPSLSLKKKTKLFYFSLLFLQQQHINPVLINQSKFVIIFNLSV